jgi:diaminopimelate decarboxylase
VGNAGILVTRVLYRKERRTEVPRGRRRDERSDPPGALRVLAEIRAVGKRRGRIVADVVGPICEIGDFLAEGSGVPARPRGDLLAVMSAGPTGLSASSTITRPRVPEVLVRGSEIHVIRRRETWEDLVRGETIPEFLRNG